MKQTLLFLHWYLLGSMCLFAQAPKTYFVDIEKTHLFVKEYPHKNTKAPKIVFLHGGAGDNHLNFLPHCEALKEDFHLYFYDQTDAGQSYSDQKLAYTIDREVENLEKLRKYWKIDKLHLIGHSWGSILALFYAQKYPQNVQKMILTGSIGTEASYFQLFAQNLQKKLKPEDYKMMQDFYAQNAPQQDYLDKITLKYYFADTSKIKMMTKTQINFEVNKAIAQDIFVQFKLKGKLNALDFPILVLQGRQDLLTIEEIKGGFEGIKQIQFSEIDQAGHWAFVEQSAQFTRLVIKFFKK